VRVTKERISVLIDKVVKETLKDRQASHEATRTKFADNVYIALYTPAEHGVLQSLPDGFFCTKNSVQFAVPRASYEETLKPFSFGEARRFACKHQWDSCLSKDDFSPAEYEVLVAEWRDLWRAKQKLDAEKDGLKEKLRVFLAPLTTYAKLFAAWPEAANYITVPEKEKNLPTVLVDDVRETIARMKG